MAGDDGSRPSVSHPTNRSPAEVRAYWAEAMPRAHAAMARAKQLAPQLVGLTVGEAREVVARDPELSLRVLAPGPIPPAGVFGRISVDVVDDRVVTADAG